MKPVLVYAALVGLPLAGLAAVLHAGADLHAPPDVGGRWGLEWPTGRLSPRPEDRFFVAQSGTHVTVDLFRRAYRGSLRGDSVVGESGSAKEGMIDDCFGSPHGHFAARIDTSASPIRMTFTMSATSPHPCAYRGTAIRIDADGEAR
jgi:hypothetical protein